MTGTTDEDASYDDDERNRRISITSDESVSFGHGVRSFRTFTDKRSRHPSNRISIPKTSTLKRALQDETKPKEAKKIKKTETVGEVESIESIENREVSAEMMEI